MFAVPSDAPSTPERRSLQSMPSTTPAGPPPSNRALPSFTPKGPPPSSTYGSSQFGTGGTRPLFGEGSANNTNRRFPPSSPPQPVSMEESDDDMDAMPTREEDSMMIDDSLAQMSPGGFDLMDSISGTPRFASPRGNKRTRAGEILKQSPSMPRRIQGLDVAGYAKGAVASAPAPRLNDPDELIIYTERFVEPLVAAIRCRAEQDEIAELAGQLCHVWQKFGSLNSEEIHAEKVGPESDDDGVARANMVGSLLLLLHHPHSTGGESVPLPKLLLDWLDRFHDPSAETVESVLAERRGYFAASGFWDAIYLALNRGRFGIAIKILEGASFEDSNEYKFTDRQLDGIEHAVDEAIQLLEQCPAIMSQDWDVRGSDWTLFRHRVEKTRDQLREYAEAESGASSLWGSRLGKSVDLTRSQASRNVDSNVPFEVYEPLQDMYKQLLGEPSEILKSCYDWLEAAITVTVWWDGNDSAPGKGSLSASRMSLSRQQRTREVDVNPLAAYRNQIASAFGLALAEEDVKESYDIMEPVHLAFGCTFLGEIELAVALMKSWSIPIATAIAEVATTGGWVAGGARGTIENFDQSDLMVLSYGQGGLKTSKKDELLELYADLLSRREEIEAIEPESITMDGWELALRVLGRLDDMELARRKVSALLDGINFASNDQVDSVLLLCNELGFGQHAMAITEKYADSLAESTHRYGDALLYYARSHTFTKAKRVIDVLITSSLVQSIAYPPIKDLDERMKAFIASPKETLNSLASIDFEAAQRLASWLSGYATLRKFYNLRDESAVAEHDFERRRNAAEALLAVILSANDPIRGGLFDPSAQVVVPVDGLIVLLGEALPLLKHAPSVFKTQQLFALLTAVEDLQTIGQRIYQQCETLFQTSLENAYGSDVPSPRAMLRKDASNLTASSQFSLVGSSLLSSAGALEKSVESGVLVGTGDVKRGWDWRRGLPRTSKGDDVLRILRLLVAEKVADAWAEGGEEE